MSIAYPKSLPTPTRRRGGLSYEIRVRVPDEARGAKRLPKTRTDATPALGHDPTLAAASGVTRRHFPLMLLAVPRCAESASRARTRRQPSTIKCPGRFAVRNRPAHLNRAARSRCASAANQSFKQTCRIQTRAPQCRMTLDSAHPYVKGSHGRCTG
jgi:hypothetical protein